MVSIHLADDSLTAGIIQLPRQAGYQVAVFTVNDAARARSLLSMGVDSLISDDPGHILAHLADGPDDRLRDVVG